MFFLCFAGPRYSNTSDGDLCTPSRPLQVREAHKHVYIIQWQSSTQNVDRHFNRYRVFLCRAKPCKPLRAALHAITAAAPPGKSPVGVVSDALRDGRWNDAKAELASMRAAGAVPKLGALQVHFC
jgi:hypothetical protein